MAQLAELLPPPGSDPLEVLDAFAAWAAASGRPLYQHQEDASFALAAGDHVVLATPTGSGKSLVAVAGVLLARNAGLRAVWTAPIKALVAEKFFDLVELLGAVEVGLATGDAAINSDAPVLVCTAEVLANHALVTGPASPFGFACLDEFHYYGDADRGWAWQVPLLELTACQMLLASATLGDMTAITTDLAERSGRGVTAVTSVDRPTPLYHQWRTTRSPRASARRSPTDSARCTSCTPTKPRRSSGRKRSSASTSPPAHSARRSPRRWPTFGWAGDSATPSTD